MRVVGYLTLSEKPALRDAVFMQGMRELELVINAKVAHSLGLKMPQSIMVRANQVIE